MKISELTPQIVGSWLGVCDMESEPESDVLQELDLILAAAVARASSFTGQSAEKLDAHEELTVAVLGICNDYYTANRPEWAEHSINKMSEALLGAYSSNLL